MGLQFVRLLKHVVDNDEGYNISNTC